jgi:uncharacterized Zn finger protein
VREDFRTKAVRYLGEGRLTVHRVGVATVRATCRGDSAEIYELGYAGGRWSCTCPARTRCAHLQALMLVVLRPTEEAA